MTDCSLFNVSSGAEFRLQNAIVNGNTKTIMNITGGTVYVEGTTLQNAALASDYGAAINASGSSKVYIQSFTPSGSSTPIPSKIVNNFATKGAGIYASGSGTTINVDESVELGLKGTTTANSFFHAASGATLNINNGSK